MENECRGCLCYDGSCEEVFSWENLCMEVIPYISETERCPCITCLLKGVCENECDKFKLYKELIGKSNGK